VPEESTVQSLKVDLDAAPAVRQLNQGYTGWGGIPGYIMVNFWPDDQNLPKLGPCVAHEFNQQIRLTVEPWQMEISVAEYIVMEGLGENLAEARRVVGRALEVRGFNEVRRYIFGDQVMAGFGVEPMGVPTHAGYAIGYHLVQAYLGKTGKTAAEATLVPSDEIVRVADYF